MKASAYIDNHVFCLHLTAENTEDAEIIFRAAKSVLKPVVSYGSVDNAGVWAWFNIPLRQNEKWGFNNDTDK